MTDLLPETITHINQYYRLFWRDRTLRVSFDFQNLSDSERLSYELVTWDNYKHYLPLFEVDTNPYIMDEFRTRADLEKYIAFLQEYCRYSSKRGGCDWLIRLKKGPYVGVLHIHALNRELINGRLQPCKVGYAIAEPYRRRGYASEALIHLLELIPTIFKRYEVEATVHKRNVASRAVLRKAGLIWKSSAALSESLWYKKLVDPIPQFTSDDLLNGLI
jgi:RimJ/RimL family protein N-acetyltransferase